MNLGGGAPSSLALDEWRPSYKVQADATNPPEVPPDVI